MRVFFRNENYRNFHFYNTDGKFKDDKKKKMIWIQKYSSSKIVYLYKSFHIFVALITSLKYNFLFFLKKTNVF